MRFLPLALMYAILGLSLCNPKPPDPPATCPEQCPLGTACNDPSLGCQPIPAPGHVCVVDKEFCNCYVMPPESGTWLLTTCPEGQECTEDYQCKSITPEDPCQDITCAIGYHCASGQCVKDDTPPPPTTGNCPKEFTGSRIYMRNKAYGQGFDSTVRVYGDPQFCFLIHGEYIDDCHLEGWHDRSACEMELLLGCPIWQYTPDGGKTVLRCHNDKSPGGASCDHFGDPVFRDDPETPEFEGRPLKCGLQRDEFGPNAGFFAIAHGGPSGCTSGNGPFWHVRACRPDGKECGPWVKFCK